MAVILYDKDGNTVGHHDTEDKLHWCVEGESKEQAFVRVWGDRIGYAMNPEKKGSKFAPDLISMSSGVLADLKSQHSPFFTAQKNYGLEPTYAVVFNVKDRHRYEELYPEIDIIYYVNWIAVKANIYGKIYEVVPHLGIYKIAFRDLLPILDQAPVHEYGRRRDDQRGNAKESYVLDIRDPGFFRLI